MGNCLSILRTVLCGVCYNGIVLVWLLLVDAVLGLSDHVCPLNLGKG